MDKYKIFLSNKLSFRGKSSDKLRKFYLSIFIKVHIKTIHNTGTVDNVKVYQPIPVLFSLHLFVILLIIICIKFI